MFRHPWSSLFQIRENSCVFDVNSRSSLVTTQIIEVFSEANYQLQGAWHPTLRERVLSLVRLAVMELGFRRAATQAQS